MRRGPRTGRYHRRRAARPAILILCEGTKTEPNYFSDLKEQRRLPQLRVLGLAPGDGLRGLAQRVELEVEPAQGLDEIWCVVDHDEREVEFERFLTKVKKLQNLRSRPRIRVVVSMPCFEYWFLLHFENTTRAFHGSSGGNSACDQVISKLRRHWPNYQKNDRRLFLRLQEHLPGAIEYAKRKRAEGASFTDVWKLVERLGALADPVHSAGVGPVAR